jgi:hypothetical protein
MSLIVPVVAVDVGARPLPQVSQEPQFKLRSKHGACVALLSLVIVMLLALVLHSLAEASSMLWGCVCEQEYNSYGVLEDCTDTNCPTSDDHCDGKSGDLPTCDCSPEGKAQWDGTGPSDGLCGSAYLDGLFPRGYISGDLLIVVPLVILVLYGFYLNECRGSHTRKYLKNMLHDSDTLAATIFEMCTFKFDTIAFHVVCSHQTTHTDSDGNTHTNTVVSYSGEEVCTLAQVDDNSDFSGLSLDHIQAIVKGWGNSSRALIEIDSEWSVTDSDGSLEKMKLQLYASNRHRDSSCSVTVKSCAPKSFKESQSIQVRALPGTISSGAFWAFSALLLTVPYRMHFETWTGKIKCSFIKKVAGVTAGAQPAMSVVQPAMAVVQPAMSVVQPAMAVVQPAMAVVQPAMAVVQPAMAVVQPATIAAPAADHIAMILKLKGLLDAGAITQEEFDAKKAEQLAQM